MISAKTRVDAPRPQTMMLFAKLAAAGYVSYAGLAALRAAPKDDAMTCGDAVHLCGVLTLASGLGQGAYAHPTPSVHGLWPETGSYGTSDCVAPTGSTADPTSVIDCYAATGDDDAGTVSFETHEWDKHGECAGAVDAPTRVRRADYFPTNRGWGRQIGVGSQIVSARVDSAAAGTRLFR